jgi:hypothetical protein
MKVLNEFQKKPERANNGIERVLNRLMPGTSVRTKVFVGTTVCMTVLGVTFFGGKAKKAGHGAFDTEKPEAVQSNLDEGEKARLARFANSKNK